jgi:hypothetical protein
MNYPTQTGFTALAAKRVRPSFKKWFSAWVVLGLLLSLCVARVQAQDDDYLAVYGMIDQADALNTSGKTSQAHSKYIQAKQALVTFQQNYPAWNTATVNFRLKYLAEKIAATVPAAKPAPAAVPPASVPSTPSASSISSAASSSAPGSVVAGAPSPAKLLDAGSEPRTVLRLHPVAGDKQSITMTTKTSMSMSAGGSSMPAMTIPTTEMGADISVLDVSAGGEVTYQMVFGEPNVMEDTNTMPGVVDMMKTTLAGMKGMTGTGKVSSKGVSQGLTMKIPPGLSPQLSQTLGQMKDTFSSFSIVFPEEAVGAGAKWEYSTKLKSQGVSLEQTMNYELVSVNGDQLTLRGTIKQQAANQMIESPTMPGLKVNLTKMDGTTTVDATLDLGQVMPQMATMDGATDMSMSMAKQGQMNMSMKLNVTMEGK